MDAYGAAGYLSFDLGLYRSLDYYTGMLFEVYLPEMGYPVAGGGRYDKMMQRFGMECPATGFAVGVDRVLLALNATALLPITATWDVPVALERRQAAGGDCQRQHYAVKAAALCC